MVLFGTISIIGLVKIPVRMRLVHLQSRLSNWMLLLVDALFNTMKYREMRLRNSFRILNLVLYQRFLPRLTLHHQLIALDLRQQGAGCLRRLCQPLSVVLVTQHRPRRLHKQREQAARVHSGNHLGCATSPQFCKLTSARRSITDEPLVISCIGTELCRDDGSDSAADAYPNQLVAGDEQAPDNVP